jgi:hypothetical protein
MKNQTTGNGGASPKLHAIVNPASKKISERGPAADSSKGKSNVPASVAGQSAAPGSMVPHSEKGGHD